MLNKTFEYQTDNYEPYNRAVDAEIARQNQLTDALRSQVDLNKSLVFLRWAGITALLIVSISFAVWLFQAKPSPNYTNRNPISSTIDVQRTASIIQQSSQQPSAAIKTKFTVFETMTTDSGKQVVTGRVYTPENLDTPTRQYCYQSVEMDTENPLNSQADSDTLIRTLANKDDGKVEILTKDPSLIELSNSYCRFI